MLSHSPSIHSGFFEFISFLDLHPRINTVDKTIKSLITRPIFTNEDNYYNCFLSECKTEHQLPHPFP